MRHVILPIWLFMTPALALADCPPGQDFADQTAQHLTGLLSARNEAEAQQPNDALWQIWLTAPDSTAQEMLDRAMSRRDAYDFKASESILDELITYCPTYAEAWNQRAFSRFLRGNYDGALEDIAIALEMVPYHFGALSGRGLTLMRQGRMRAGQKALRQAVRIHPFLQERAMLLDEFDEDI